ncbi:hypothetical protein C8Z91_06225 [Paenibacillus elgii]|uniref:Uncharacterized protein n=1 Tax=Paenibacillus elgii TaxID=189691 RepID=A0A2T6G7H2_9BACL|nr:hypothetical protein [Paenibacillus elgii]PUA40090.1 hypothetical protein C8Z91_06225 [Paenibacillus elgii]
MIETIYRRNYDSYMIVVNKLPDGTYDVLMLPSHSNLGISIELVRSEFHALKGAEQFPTFYEIAKENGFNFTDHYFRHKDGRELHSSYAMDLDCTAERFLTLLQKGA